MRPHDGTRRVVPLIVACVTGAAIAAPRAQGKRPVTHEALWLMPRVGAPAPSPDGKWVVFSVVQPAYDERDQQSDLWMVATDGGAAPRRLTFTKAAESGVAWSADSRRIAFATRREGDEANQIYTLDLATGGEAASATSISTVRPPRRLASGRQGAAVHEPRLPERRRRCREQADRRRAQGSEIQSPGVRQLPDPLLGPVAGRSPDPRVRAEPRRGQPGRGSAGRHEARHRTRATAAAGSIRARKSTRSGRLTASPSSSPRRRTATRRRTPTSTLSSTRCPARGGEPRQLTHDKVTYEHPRFRPGRHARCTSRPTPTTSRSTRSTGSRWRAWPWPAAGAPAILSPGFDRSVESWAFTPDSQRIYLTAEDAGLEKVYAVSASGGETTLAVAPPRGVYTNLTIAPRAPGHRS